MQGRLSQKKNSPLQSFPSKTWSVEFSRAREIGFNKIEWLIDNSNTKDNPLFSEDGRQKIIELSKNNKIKINTLCFHYFIYGEILKSNLHSSKIRNFFFKTIELAPLIGIKYLSIPLMDKMSLKNKIIFEEMSEFLKEVSHDLKIEILIESDLEKYELLNFIENIDSPKIGILYDTGNATKNNFVFEEDFSLLSKYIKEIHIKDFSLRSHQSVRLGHGNTNFINIFKIIKDQKWKGPLVLETPIFDNWQAEAKLNLNYIFKILKN